MSTAERFEEICTNVTDVVVSDNSNDEGKNCRNETWTEIEINAIRMNQHYITVSSLQPRCQDSLNFHQGTFCFCRFTPTG